MKTTRVYYYCPLAGSKSYYSYKGFEFWCPPLAKSLADYLVRVKILKIRHCLELKAESKSILEFATSYVSKITGKYKILTGGGYSPKRKKAGIPDTAQLAREFLLHSLPESCICIDDTSHNSESKSAFLSKIIEAEKYDDSSEISIILIASKYHLKRALIDLKSKLGKAEIKYSITAIPVKIQPDEKWCWADRLELYYNKIVEPFKFFASRHLTFLVNYLSAKEKRRRERV